VNLREREWTTGSVSARKKMENAIESVPRDEERRRERERERERRRDRSTLVRKCRLC
jgi:hypothetical protein